MYTILSKMLSGLVSVPSLSHSVQPTDCPQQSQNAGHSPLMTCFHGVHQNGCLDSEAVHRLDLLLTAAGPVCYTDHLVHVRHNSMMMMIIIIVIVIIIINSTPSSIKNMPLYF